MNHLSADAIIDRSQLGRHLAAKTFPVRGIVEEVRRDRIGRLTPTPAAIEEVSENTSVNSKRLDVSISTGVVNELVLQGTVLKVACAEEQALSAHSPDKASDHLDLVAQVRLS